MNERIRELYRQAHTSRTYDGDPMREGNPPTVYWQGEVSARRFAELIIKECIEACYKHKDVEGFGILPVRVALVTKACAGNIKEHFGVQE